MAQAIGTAFEAHQHLLVQAGTGTGKSLGYLAPSLDYVLGHPDQRVLIATATLALQAQLAHTDIPAAIAAAEEVTGRRLDHAVLKGRSNYVCLHKIRDSVGVERRDQDSLLGAQETAAALRESRADDASVLGAEVVALREWAEEQASQAELADRDDAPTHTAAAWSQVSISARECLGASNCPFGEECFVERSRERARAAQIVVTNHAMLAIDAMNEGAFLPEHAALVIDEAHELVDRVTGAASVELSPQQIERVARRCLDWVEDDLGLDFLDQADALKDALADAPLDRVTSPDGAIAVALGRIRETARAVASAMAGGGDDAQRKQAASAVKEILDVATEMAAMRASDVLYVSERDRFGRWLVMAPLNVAGLLRENVLAGKPVVLTSATLKLGGDFNAVAASIGLKKAERVHEAEASADSDDNEFAWQALDVGSPFDYGRQGIMYVADALPSPGRDGLGAPQLAEIAELVWAADGRALGLFSSQRNAEAAARHCRAELPGRTILCQGDAQLSELTRRFAAEPRTSLFGTLSLWQGVDVPGDTCLLVILDKIPFPRPDDPLLQARQANVAASGGNGFMAVAATHAALLLAQGAGRLIRRVSDRGVVAVLDPRLKTARYGGFLRASMPDFWQTTDREVAVSALRRLAEQADAS